MMRKDTAGVTQDRLQEVLIYDKETGILKWRVTRGPNAKAGRLAGAYQTNGYIRVMLNGRLYAAHRLAWLYVHGVWPENELDHINGIRDDNRIANLREASHAENHQNKAIQKNNRSGINGVHWHSRDLAWQAKIMVGGKLFHIGYFPSKEAAAEAYSQAKAKHHKFQPTIRKARNQ